MDDQELESQRTRVKPNTTAPETESSEKIIPNDIMLYSEISASFIHHQRSFLMNQTATNTKTKDLSPMLI